METRILLIVGSILLCCGCVGMLIVRFSNPVLRGLGWLGGSFAAGAAGAAILAFSDGPLADSYVLAADTLILLGFVLLQICILELTESVSLVPRLGIALLTIQFLSFAVYHYIHRVNPYSIVTFGILVALQALQAANTLKKSLRPGMLAPSWLSIAILVIFAVFNFFRSGAILLIGAPHDPTSPNPYQLVSVIVFLGTGLGIGFAVFWMTSSQICILLEQLANTDPLTGIHNRRSFMTMCERELLRSSRTAESFSLIMMDIDHFKQINDRFGHPTGDAALRAVVEKLRDSVRNIDVVARWGGEEFVALLPGANSEAALIVAQRLRRKVETLAIQRPPSRASSGISNRPNIEVTISLGVATYLGPNDSIDALINRCDQALYQAKSAGRNRVV